MCLGYLQVDPPPATHDRFVILPFGYDVQHLEPLLNIDSISIGPLRQSAVTAH